MSKFFLRCVIFFTLVSIKVRDIIRGRLYGYDSSSYLWGMADDFNKRQVKLAPVVYHLFQLAKVDGVPVVDVGDMVWWPRPDRITALASVRLADERFLVLGFDNGKFDPPLPSHTSWLLNNVKDLPTLELANNHIDVSITAELSLMVVHGYEYGTSKPPSTWRFLGTIWSGSAALKKIARRGLTLSHDSDE